VDKLIITHLQKKADKEVPFWFMRQAGRYLPEYRKIRKQAGSFLDLCYNPSLASEVTLQPIRRFDMSAAILFSDILVVPHALGVDVRFEESKGPIVEKVLSEQRIDLFKKQNFLMHLAPVCETIRLVKSSLTSDKALIGFAGSPFTVASYMVEGGGSKDHASTREFFYSYPHIFQRLIDEVSEATILYLSAQIDAGCDVVQLFDSWAGVLSPTVFETYSIQPHQKIVKAIKEKFPHIPIICFPRGAGANLEAFCRVVACDGIALDTSMPLSFAKKVTQGKTIQGNLDPALLVGDLEILRKETLRILDEMRGYPFIFNLGHGCTPQTRIEHLEIVSNIIRHYR
jgi:uroporphyrinogen decarboxylase